MEGDTACQHAAPREVIVRFGDDERTLIGDYHVFLWYRFEHACPHVLSAALMALEFWFTERIVVGTGYESAAANCLRRLTMLESRACFALSDAKSRIFLQTC